MAFCCCPRGANGTTSVPLPIPYYGCLWLENKGAVNSSRLSPQTVLQTQVPTKAGSPLSLCVKRGKTRHAAGDQLLPALSTTKLTRFPTGGIVNGFGLLFTFLWCAATCGRGSGWVQSGTNTDSTVIGLLTV
ncbi:MAG: hypothetical protein ACK5Q5_23715 [Planctomycetaceae bacterium]